MPTPKLPSTASVQDYLTQTGQSGSFSNRAKLYKNSGLEKRLGSYTGSANQNNALLNYLRSNNSTPTNRSGNPSFFSGQAPSNAFTPYQAPSESLMNSSPSPSFYEGEAPPNAFEAASQFPSFFEGQAPPNAYEAEGAAAAGAAGTASRFTPNTRPFNNAPFTPRMNVGGGYSYPAQPPAPTSFSPQSTSAFTPRSASQFTPRSVATTPPAQAPGAAMNATRFLSANPALAGAVGFGLPAGMDMYNSIRGSVDETFEDESTRNARTTPQTRTVNPPAEQPQGAGGVGGGSFTSETPTPTGAQNDSRNFWMIASPEEKEAEKEASAAESLASIFPNYTSPTDALTGEQEQETATPTPTPQQAGGGAQTTQETPEIDFENVNTIDTELGAINEQIAQYRRFGEQVPPQLIEQKIGALNTRLDAIRGMMGENAPEGADMTPELQNSVEEQNQATAEATGVAGTDVAGEEASLTEIEFINQWLNSTEGKLALERAELDGMTAEQKAEVAKEILDAKYAQELESLKNKLAQKGLAFSGISASQVKALADNLATSELAVDRELASKLLDADLNFRETILDGVADLIESAQNDDEEAIQQLNLAGYAVVNGELIPTLSMLREQRIVEEPDYYITTNSAGQVSAYDKKTGELLWRTEGGVGRSGSSSPSIRVTPIADPATGTVTAIQNISSDGTIQYIDPATGEPLDPTQVQIEEGQDPLDALINDIVSDMNLGEGV